MRVGAMVALAVMLGVGPVVGQSAGAGTPAPAQKVGGARARVVIEEYSDLQCPYCATHEMRFAESVERWVRQQKGAVRFDFYDVALPRHAYAAPAARAARCAGLQGRYAQARHGIFAEQEHWAAASDAIERVTDIARSVVRDTARFNTCLARDAGRMDRILAANLQRARDLDVPGTPAFLIFVDERMAQIVDPASPDSIAAVVRSLKEKK